MKPGLFICILFAELLRGYAGDSATGNIVAGQSFLVRGEQATVTKVTNLPFVDSEFSRRFKFDSFANPKLKALREKQHLVEVISAGATEFDKQVLLMNWVHEQFPRFGKPSIPAKGALEILDGIEKGGTFFCAQYAQLMVSAAASLGWVDRSLALRRHKDGGGDGSTEHSTTEIWSNQYAKWVMLDPTSNMYLEKAGVPLNAAEIRQEWFYNDAKDLDFVIGRERKKYKKADLPVFLKKFPNFGNLQVNPEELDKYGFIGYIPNTDLMDAGEDYGKMVIAKDQLCDGTKWHTRPGPKDIMTDLYFPVGQAALAIQPSSEGVSVQMKTLTPNFKRFEVRTDGGNWKAVSSPFDWKLHSKGNRLEARTVNEFGVAGPVSEIGITVGKPL